MSNSNLVNYTRISPNRNSPRNHAIDRISIHCVVGQCTAERIGEIFAPESREASSNYGIGLDGRIGMYVEEKDRSWCTSSGANDHRAVTIEVASDTAHPYAVKTAAFSALLDLCTDICKRNGKKRLLWFGDKEKTLAYTPKADEMVLTVHRWFANKACPGEYLYSRHGEIAEEVTKRLAAADKPAEPTAPAGTGDNPSAWAKAATEYCKRKGIFAGDGAGNFDWQKPITREQVAAVLYRTLERAGLLEALPDKE
ncbi:N-acetylmuramoyl-L-alanine amidase [Acutalibacter caecimuris]|uniref:N-acetylmuramoyl-L-alanine amidase n=1 Tax=Acutalibacter caecimuris TaxID=3093657 RepID=UPI002AC9B1FB|nr:N-acetylmuramoyl-L-alanine amidase [Acutalibacter sp. M00118]